MSSVRVVIVGGGAAGIFAAIACAEAGGGQVIVLERGPQFLAKVRISGGGRCNVTHRNFEPREFARHYPRGEHELIGALSRFRSTDTVAWFESRGVKLKIESDGRIFPTTNNSQTIIDCLLREAQQRGVKLLTRRGVERAKVSDGRFKLTVSGGEIIECERLLLATGGCRTPALGALAVSLGHTLQAPVPSLFTFHIDLPWLHELAGISVEPAEVNIPDTTLRERGPVLITHWGLSGPVILRLSAWGARTLQARDYRFRLEVNWLPDLSPDKLAAEIQHRRVEQGGRSIARTAIGGLPGRLWEQLVAAAEIPGDTPWSALSRTMQHQLTRQLQRTEFQVTGKSLNKEEFVTCGGVSLREVNFKTMESRIQPGLFFAGELLDIDGITGGFNFQAAWTTGWIAGRAMALPTAD